MSEYIRVSGKTVEDAVMEASIALGTSSDNVEYNVIERETKGFLGIGAKKAVIEARKKQSDEEYVNSVFGNKETAEKPAPAVKAEKQVKAAPVKEASEKKEQPVKKAADVKKAAPAAEKAEKEVSPAAEDERSEGRKNREAGRTPADPKEVQERAEKFLKDMFAAMGQEVTVSQTFEDGTLSVTLDGDNMGMLIGKRGQTLDSIQYLTSLVVNKGKNAYVRVKIDTENYRERRKATLENLAKNMAMKAKKSRRPVYLEPMNPYERRIIHSALQDDAYVTTHSEGEEPARKVVITLKKREYRDEQ